MPTTCDRAPQQPGLRKGQQHQLNRGRKAARRGDIARAADPFAIQLGQPVHELLQQLRARMRRAVVARVAGRVLHAERAGHIDDARVRAGHRVDHLAARAVRQAHDHRVHAARRFGMRRVLEAQLSQPLEVRVRARNQLAHVIVGAHPNHLELGMVEQTPKQFRAREPGRSEHRNFGFHAAKS